MFLGSAGNQYHGCRQCRRHRSLSLPLCLWAIGQLGVHRCHCLHYLCSFLVKKTFCPHLSTSPIISSTSWSVSLIFPLPVMISLNSSVLSVPEPSLSKTCNATIDLGFFGFPPNLERLPQIFLPVLRFSKLAANRIRELGQLDVHPASIAAIRPSELHLGLFCVA